MRIVIVSDIHGESLDRLESQVLRSFMPDLVLCLGDFDQTRTIREVMELQKRYRMEVVPGNHEHAIYHGIPITSDAMRKQGKSFHDLYQELHSDPLAESYVEGLLRTPKKEMILDRDRFGGIYRTIIIHGALGGDLMSNPDAQRIEAELWYRLRSERDHAKNFAVMEKQNFRVMLRGHDAEQTYAYRDPQKGIAIYEGGRDYRLFPHRLHTITVGDYFDGHYALLDTNVPRENQPLLSLRRF